MPISSANITLRQLAALVAVVDHGGFAAAAGALNMTQSAVSQAIRALERALEAPLLVRSRGTTRGGRPAPTALGEVVLRHARAALEEVERAAAAAREQQGHDTDTLLAMVAAGAGVTLVPRLGLAAFDSPQVRAVPLDPPAARTVTAVLTAGKAAPRAAFALVELLRSHVERRAGHRGGRHSVLPSSPPHHPRLSALG